MALNKLIFQESSLIDIDQEVEAAKAGWTLNHVAIVRTGAAVQLHIEAAFGIAAAAAVCKLPAMYAPGATVTTPDGKFTLAADGTLSFTGSTTSAGSAVAQLNYAAASVSP